MGYRALPADLGMKVATNSEIPIYLGTEAMNLNTPLFSAEEIEALRADLIQPKAREAEPVDLASGDHALRKVIPIVERRLELLSGAIELALARALRENFNSKADPPDVVGPRTAMGTMREMSIVCEIHADEIGLIGFIGMETVLSFLLIERAFGSAIVDGPSAMQNWTTPQRSRLTSVERNTHLPTLNSLIAELDTRVFENEGGKLSLEQVPAGLPPELPPQVESTILWKIYLDIGGNPSGLALLLLPNLVEILIRNDSADLSVLPLWMSAHLGQTNVTLRAVLGNINLAVEELVSLEPGDILRLDASQEDLVPVQVEGKTKLMGSPIQQNGAFGVEIKAEYL